MYQLRMHGHHRLRRRCPVQCGCLDKVTYLESIYYTYLVTFYFSPLKIIGTILIKAVTFFVRLVYQAEITNEW